MNIKIDSSVKIVWYKDDIPIDVDSKLNLTINNDSRFLYFTKISYKLHDGVYKCSLLLDNNQRVYSENNLIVKTLGFYFIYRINYLH